MIPSEIRRIRESKKMSRDVLAATLNVSPGSIVNWETGATKPSRTNLAKLRAVFFEGKTGFTSTSSYDDEMVEAMVSCALRIASLEALTNEVRRRVESIEESDEGSGFKAPANEVSRG